MTKTGDFVEEKLGGGTVERLERLDCSIYILMFCSTPRVLYSVRYLVQDSLPPPPMWPSKKIRDTRYPVHCTAPAAVDGEGYTFKITIPAISWQIYGKCRVRGSQNTTHLIGDTLPGIGVLLARRHGIVLQIYARRIHYYTLYQKHVCMFEICFLKRRAYSANGLTAPRPIGIDSSFTAASSSFKHAHDHCSRSSEDATSESHKTLGLFSKQQVLKIPKKGYTVDT